MNVLIVGAGPAGAALGDLPARSGIGVVQLEREPHFGRPFRGEVMMPSGLAALRELGRGAKRDEGPSRRFDSWRFHYRGELVFRYGEPPDAGPVSRILSRAALLELLVAAAQRFPDDRFESGLTARDAPR